MGTKHCREEGMTFDRRTGKCKERKRCPTGFKKNRKTGECQKKGKLVSFTLKNGENIKFRVKEGTDKATRRIMARNRFVRKRCRDLGGRPYTKKDGTIGCPTGPKRQRKAAAPKPVKEGRTYPLDIAPIPGRR